MISFIYIGQCTYQLFGVDITKTVVLFLPYENLDGSIVDEDIKVFEEGIAVPGIDMTNELEIDEFVYYLVNALYRYNTYDTIYSIDSWYTLRAYVGVKLAYDYLDDMITRRENLERYPISECIMYLKQIVCHLDRTMLPKACEHLEYLCEQESWNRYYTRKAKAIQHAWFNAYYNPDHHICQTRLEHEFSQLVQQSMFAS